MPLPDDIEDLHRIAEHHTACRALRRMGWTSIVFGLINLAIGVCFTLYASPINLLLVLLSLLLLGAGILCLTLPGAEGAIVTGIAWVLIGLWTIFVGAFNLLALGRPDVWWTAFGVLMIVGAVQAFRKYSRYSTALRQKVPKEHVERMNNLVKTILNARFDHDEDIIGFQMPTAPFQDFQFFGSSRQRQWRCLLGRDVAVFVDRRTKEVLVADKANVSIAPYGKAFLSSKIKANVKFKDKNWEVTMSPTSFDRFRDWKFSDIDEEYFRKDATSREKDEPHVGIRTEDDLDKDSPAGIQQQLPRTNDGERPADD
jgi:hypothetical protein